MTYVGDLQRFGGGSVGATEAWGKTTAQWLQDVASRAGANYRKDIFWIAPGNALNALGALQQCWQNNQPVNIMQMMQSGVAVFKPFNYSTDMLSFPVSPGDIFAIPKDWGLMPACAHGVVDINGKPVTIDPQSKSKTAAPTVMHRAPGLPSSSKPLPTASKPLPTTSKPAVSAPTRAPVAPSSIAKKSTAIYWLGGLVVVLGGVAAYLKYGAGVKSNPRRPPKKWFRDCERGVGPGYDPGSVCGALWYHKMSPAQKRAALAKENPADCPCPFKLE